MGGPDRRRWQCTFDIHDDVTFLTPIQATDRFIFSDENQPDDPMRYATATTLATYINDQAADANNYVQSAAFSHAGTDFTLTMPRLGLASVTTTINLDTVVGVPIALTATEAGGDLTITLDRSVGVDLTATVSLPSSGGGFSMEQIQDGMSQFLNFSGGITDTYNDVSNVYNISTVVVEDFANAGSATKIVAGDIADETITKDQIASGTIRGEQIAESSLHYSDLLAINVYVPDENFLSFVGTGGTDVSLKYYNAADFRTAIGASDGTVVTANPTADFTASLNKLTVATTIYGVRNLFDVVSLSDRPAPGALTVGQGYYVKATSKLYIGVDDPHTSAAPEGDFTAQTVRTDLHFVDHLPTNLNNLTIGDFWFQRPIQEFYKLVQRAGVRNLEQKHPQAGLAGDQTDTSRPVVFLGLVATDAEALSFTYAIFTSNDYFYIDSDTDEVKLLDNSSFTAPGQTAHHYQYAEIGGGGGGGVALSDDDPVSVNIALNDPGTATDASRRDHRHRVDQSNTTRLGVTRYATNAEALLGTSTTRTINPVSLAHVLANSTSTGDITAVNTAANSGLAGGCTTGACDIRLNLPGLPLSGTVTATGFLAGATAGGTSVEYRADTFAAFVIDGALSDADPEDGADAAQSGTSSDVSRSDHVHGGGSGSGSSDTKVVTALPDAADVVDDDKDKLWLVVPTADEGIVEVAHFAPADDPEIFKMTAQAFMQGPASYVGYDVTDNGGHLEPSDTNIQRIAFGHTFSNYEIEFNENKTSPFDYNDYSSDGLNLYFREEGTTGNWRRYLLEIPNANDTHEYGSAISQTDHFVAGTTYDVIIRTTGVSGNQAVSSVPTSDRLQSHPAGGAFKSFVDEDDLGPCNCRGRDEP